MFDAEAVNNGPPRQFERTRCWMESEESECMLLVIMTAILMRPAYLELFIVRGRVCVCVLTRMDCIIPIMQWRTRTNEHIAAGSDAIRPEVPRVVA